VRRAGRLTPVTSRDGSTAGLSASAAGDDILLPRRQAGPVRTMTRRLLLALATVAVMTSTVLLDRNGYTDNRDGHVSVLDAAYYSGVSLSTTGYGDIVPVSRSARLVNLVVIMPLRVFFLALLVGTTFEVLTQRTRRQWRLNRWRSRLREHTVVIGYGNKGRAAIRALREAGEHDPQFVVVDTSASAAQEATGDGHAAIVGDATRAMILHRAGVEQAARVIVAADRDDTAALVTLSVRHLTSTATITVAVRAAENVPLLRRSGATSVITSSEAAGRLLGLAARSPAASEVIGDLLIQGDGLRLIDRSVRPEEIGASPRDCDDLILAVVRDGELLRYDQVDSLVADDRLVQVHTRS
jgi:voltage-gated potassium channel